MHPIINSIDNIINSVTLLFNNDQETSALILLYCGIDIVSSFEVKGLGKTEKKHFINWTNKYLAPKLNNKCSGEDLYGARCGLVHTLRIDSSVSDAKQIIYRSGPNSPEHDLTSQQQAALNRIKDKEYIILRVEELMEAFAAAIDEWLNDIANDPKLIEGFELRSSKMMMEL